VTGRKAYKIDFFLVKLSVRCESHWGIGWVALRPSRAMRGSRVRAVEMEVMKENFGIEGGDLEDSKSSSENDFCEFT
jgi:hypothetical protein